MKNYYIWTLGCQMNKSDSERISTVLNNIGLKACIYEKDADLIVVNACSVRQSAIDRIYGKTRQWDKFREKGKLKTVLTGCVLDNDKIKMKEKFDIILDIKEISALTNYFRKEKDLEISDEYNDYLKLIPQYNSKFQAFVPIMNGCNNFCFYCVVPHTRGREVSRDEEDILAEINQLVKDGYREITLLGQNVNSYKGKSKDSDKEIDFTQLLKKIERIEGEFWIRFLTSHPKDMSDSLIELISRSKKICSYIHLPVQSGDDSILKKMNRSYNVSHYKDLIKKIREQIPEVAISTDVIVGFPTETDQQFKKTANLFEEIKYDMAYINKYSTRSGTASAKLSDDISHEVKKQREKVLNEILKHSALGNNKVLCGSGVEVLVEKSEPSSKIFINYGHTSSYKLVKFESNKDLSGRFVNVKIIKAGAWGLFGEII